MTATLQVDVPLFPLSSEDVALGYSEQVQDALRQRILPFVQAGVLSRADVQMVDLLARKASTIAPDVFLALALAAGAPERGRVCAVLPDIVPARVSDALPEGQGEGENAALVWPENRAEWRASVAACSLVAQPSDDDGQAPFVLAGHRLYLRRLWTDEQRLSEHLRRSAMVAMPSASADLLRLGLTVLFPQAKDKERVDRQQLAAALACLRGFVVITGGPGTGKTWTVRNILTLLFAQHVASGNKAPLRVMLAAPTGKAAARMQEALTVGLDAFVETTGKCALPAETPPQALRAFLGSLQARTVHRLLRIDARRPGHFVHDAQRPLATDLLVVDEASMLDLSLMARLVDAIPHGARFLLLGDHHQLASVDAGTVLADLCNAASFDAPRVSTEVREDLAAIAGIQLDASFASAETQGLHDNVVQLTESRRFDEKSGVGAVARATLSGDLAALSRALRGNTFADVAWMELSGAGGLDRPVMEVILGAYGPIVNAVLREYHGADEVAHYRKLLANFDTFRVLCAHRQGRLGVRGIVSLIESLLPRVAPGFKARVGPYVGQPVLVTENDYAVGRFNGDIGLVVRRHGKESVVFPDPDRGVVFLSPGRLPAHETVFAMTIHKSQGSEFDHALVVLPAEPGPILTRELIYTGATRAKTRLTLVGRPEVLSAGLDLTTQRARGEGNTRAYAWGAGAAPT